MKPPAPSFALFFLVPHHRKAGKPLQLCAGSGGDAEDAYRAATGWRGGVSSEKEEGFPRAKRVTGYFKAPPGVLFGTPEYERLRRLAPQVPPQAIVVPVGRGRCSRGRPLTTPGRLM